jgi:hypothetical protein
MGSLYGYLELNDRMCRPATVDFSVRGTILKMPGAYS